MRSAAGQGVWAHLPWDHAASQPPKRTAHAATRTHAPGLQRLEHCHELDLLLVHLGLEVFTLRRHRIHHLALPRPACSCTCVQRPTCSSVCVCVCCVCVCVVQCKEHARLCCVRQTTCTNSCGCTLHAHTARHLNCVRVLCAPRKQTIATAPPCISSSSDKGEGAAVMRTVSTTTDCCQGSCTVQAST